MEFVNTIAHIVHTGVASYGGAANKNVGDAFLLVWKLPKGIRWDCIKVHSRIHIKISNVRSSLSHHQQHGQPCQARQPLRDLQDA